MMFASRPGQKALVMSRLFGWAARRARSARGKSRRVSGRWTSCARRRDSAVSPEPLGETGKGLHRHGQVYAHGCCLQALGGRGMVAGDGVMAGCGG